MPTILATLDGSALSEAILSKVAGLAKESNAVVTLLMVAQPSKAVLLTRSTEASNVWQAVDVEVAGGGQFGGQAPNEPIAVPHSVETGGQRLERIRDTSEEYLADRAKMLSGQGVQVETHVLIDDDPVKAIIDYASKGKFDVIAMSTHGRSGLNELVHGSVAGAVVKAGVAPVLLLRPSA